MLEYIHDNEYVHADIKAANLLLGDKDPSKVSLHIHQHNHILKDWLSFCVYITYSSAAHTQMKVFSITLIDRLLRR